MKSLKAYIETSVFGFYFESGAHNLEKVGYTRKLFRQIQSGIIEAYISPLVVAEINETPGPFGSKLRNLIKNYSFHGVDIDITEVEWLGGEYVRNKIISADYKDDAIHLAMAILSDVDVLVTWNCKHLANEFRIHQIAKLNKKLGVKTNLSIRTPEEVIFYE